MVTPSSAGVKPHLRRGRGNSREDVRLICAEFNLADENHTRTMDVEIPE